MNVLGKCVFSFAVLLGAFVSGPAVAVDWVYPMQRGDTVWDLSHRFLKDWRLWLAVSERNNVVADREMPPGTNIRFPVEWLRSENATVQVIKVQGEVRCYLGSPRTQRVLKAGVTMYAGDELETGEDANATLQFADGTRFLVQERSRLQLVSARLVGGEVSDAEVRLEEGRSETQANPNKAPGASFRVNTPVASVAVRGTDFRVGSENAEVMRVSVTEGGVAVSNRRGNTNLQTRQGTIIRAGKPPAPARALLPAPDLSTVAAVQRHLPIVLQWKPVPKATHYRVQVAPSASFETLLLDRLATEPSVKLARLPDGDYFLRVRPVDRDGIEGLDSQRALKVDAQPEPPFTQTPAADASVRADTLRFRWAQPAGIDRYRVQVAAKDRPGTPLFDQVLSGTEFVPTPPMAPGVYTWRIASITGAGKEGPLSLPVAFRVRPTPEFEAPEIEGQSMTFRWRGEPDERFAVEMIDERDLDHPVQTVRVTGPEATLQKPLPGVYYLRARGFDADNQPEPWGPMQKITVAPPPGVSQAVGAGALLFLLF